MKFLISRYTPLILVYNVFFFFFHQMLYKKERKWSVSIYNRRTKFFYSQSIVEDPTNKKTYWQNFLLRRLGISVISQLSFVIEKSCPCFCTHYLLDLAQNKRLCMMSLDPLILIFIPSKESQDSRNYFSFELFLFHYILFWFFYYFKFCRQISLGKQNFIYDYWNKVFVINFKKRKVTSVISLF